MTTLLYSGNVGIGQDLGTVLRAAAGLDETEDVTVRIVGGGKALPQFRKLAAELGLANVRFSPPVPLCQLPDLLASGDIHVICQRPGTQGLLVPSKIYGTLAAGRPSIFIGPRDCEVGEIIRDSESGFVVEPGDVEKATDALRYLATSATLREMMGRKGRAYYEHHFGRERSVSCIVDIIENAGTGVRIRPRRETVPAMAPEKQHPWSRRRSRLGAVFHLKQSSSRDPGQR